MCQNKNTTNFGPNKNGLFRDLSSFFCIVPAFNHRWASPFSPFSLFANGQLPFVSSSTSGQMTNFRLYDQAMSKQ
jgi:hypothetical protein